MNVNLSLGLILKRARRERRQIVVLLIAITLVTAFFALGPLYVRAMIQSGLRHELDKMQPAERFLTLVSPKPYAPAAWDTVNRQMGALNGGLVRITRSGAAFGGYDYLYGEVTFELSARSEFGHYAYAFSNMKDLLKLVEGRWPERLAPPNSPERRATTEEERIDKGLGMYSTGDVEAVIGVEVARQTGYEIGTRFAIAERPENRVVVHVVGIVDAANPADPIWEGNRRALDGEFISAGIGGRIRNLAFIVPEGAYSDWIADATEVQNRPNNNYVWRIALHAEAINADNVSDMRAGLVGLENQLAASIPGLYVLDPALKVLDRFADSVASVEGPVVLLSGAVLVLMLYHLVATASLVLEQSASEWALLASRGAGIVQLVRLQAISMGALAVIAAAAGPFLAVLILEIMLRLGPLAIAGQGGQTFVALPGIPSNAFLLSAIAGLAAILMLTLPAIPAAQRGLSRFKQLVARPPEQPLWARYGLDLLLVLLGLGFIARLLFFVEGDTAATLSLLAQDPGALIRLLIETANRSGGLNDPLNLLGPALLLTGLALLWLRLFPRLIAAFGALIGRGDGLAGPLSVWTVGRDPGRYAQLVLLLIGTLALGTAALALADTRDRGAWRAAQLQVGGAVALEVDTARAQPEHPAWTDLPGVVGAASLIRLDTQPQPGVIPATLLGVDPRAIAAAFPETRRAVTPLTDTEPVTHRPNRWQQGVTQITVYPAVINSRLAADAGRAVSLSDLPLSIGDEAEGTFILPGGVSLSLNYRVVGVVDDFPSLTEGGHSLILNAAHLAGVLGASLQPGQSDPSAPNQVWLDVPARLPSAELEARLAAMPGITTIRRAWEHYVEMLGEPLPAAITGILYAGFWVSLILSLLDFGYYLAVTARRRALSYAVLRALGWKAAAAWAQMATEQALLVVPALLVGVLFGALFAYLILPFLALAGGATLALPGAGVVLLLAALLVGFGMLTSAASLYLARLNVNQTLRLGEE